jgi:hypothetical protein
MIGKIYPNNERLDYLRPYIVFSSTKSDLERGKSKTSTFRTTYTYYLLEETNLIDYFDMRFDRLNRGRKGFFNFNMFSRIYNGFTRDDNVYHTLDMYLTTGPTIKSRRKTASHNFYFRIGPIAGTHLLFGTDGGDFWDNSGTSFRIGLALNGNINIKTASIRLMGSYERQFLVTNEYDIDYETGDLVIGDSYVREPNSFQFDLDFRMPVARNWDIYLNVNYYNIKTDVTEETTVNPDEQNMRQRIVGGVNYRFTL